MTERIARAQECLRLAARLYQLGQREPSDGLAKMAMQLCDGARLMAEGEGRLDLARWADGWGGVAFDAWMGGGS
jgi:hypothetical protein